MLQPNILDNTIDISKLANGSWVGRIATKEQLQWVVDPLVGQAI